MAKIAECIGPVRFRRYGQPIGRTRGFTPLADLARQILSPWDIWPTGKGIKDLLTKSKQSLCLVWRFERPFMTPHINWLDHGNTDASVDPLSWLRLARSRRVGPTTFHRMYREYGNAEAALLALPSIAAAAGVEDYSVCPEQVALAELRNGFKAGARLILWGQPDYPKSLMNLSDAPPILWAQGDIGLLQRPMVSLVGARNASSLGVRMARSLASSLAAAGQVVVSGLARGIDAAAHEAALSHGTVAVQAGGVDVVYPQENASLAAKIAELGCRVSEHPLGLVPQARHFPQRNRIVSGLARAVVVIEAAAKSGSLITARTAADQGRDVMAVPGHPFDARAAGCNMLIRDGAILVRTAQDVLDALDLVTQVLTKPDLPNVPKPRTLSDTNALHNQILERLGPSPVAEDQLARDLNQPINILAPALITLELEGHVLRQSGGLISRLI